jgi:hypothetical protein
MRIIYTFPPLCRHPHHNFRIYSTVLKLGPAQQSKYNKCGNVTIQGISPEFGLEVGAVWCQRPLHWQDVGRLFGDWSRHWGFHWDSHMWLRCWLRILRTDSPPGDFRAETYVGLDVQCPEMFTWNKNCNISSECSKTSQYGDMFSRSYIVTRRPTARDHFPLTYAFVEIV